MIPTGSSFPQLFPTRLGQGMPQGPIQEKCNQLPDLMATPSKKLCFRQGARFPNLFQPGLGKVCLRDQFGKSAVSCQIGWRRHQKTQGFRQGVVFQFVPTLLGQGTPQGPIWEKCHQLPDLGATPSKNYDSDRELIPPTFSNQSFPVKWRVSAGIIFFCEKAR